MCVCVWGCARVVYLIQLTPILRNRPSRDVLASNASVSRVLQQRLQQLQRCEGAEGGVEIKRHVTKALAAVRSAASCDPRAAEDDELYLRQDAKSAPTVSLQAVVAAAAAPAPSSLMSLKAQRVTSGALPPPPSLSLPWTTSSHHSALPLPAAPASAETCDGFSYSHRQGRGNHNSEAHSSHSSSEAADVPPPQYSYSAQRYSPRAEDLRDRVDVESEGQATRQDHVEVTWPSALLIPHQMTKQQQAVQLHLPIPPPHQTPPPSSVRPPSLSPSPSSSRSSPSLPSLLDSIALASAGHVPCHTQSLF